MSPRLEREAAMDDMAEHAQQFGRTRMPMAHPAVTVLPMHLAAATMPRRNIVAEYDALPVDKLIDEANELTARMLSANCGRRDYAIVVALIRRLRKDSPKLDGALWLDLPAVA